MGDSESYYADVGIAKNITFIVGPEGMSGTVAIANSDYSSHIASLIDVQPDND